ncbi:Tyrosine recombinase XerD [subsurface metagenome]
MKAYLTPEEVERMAHSAACVRDGLLIRVLFWGSCRISEALGIEVDDVNAAQGTVTIKHLKTRTRLLCPNCDTRLSRTARFCPGCGVEVPEPLRKEQEMHRIRTIPLEKRTMDRLVDFIRRDGTDGLIFKIGRIQAQLVVKECARRAGVEELINPETGKKRGVSPHRLRDAFAVMAVQADDSTDSIRMLQEHLGHQSIATTMKYRKVAGMELREWYEKLKV